jgi:hypothetical protein
MFNSLKNLLSSVWEILLVIPMPWRAIVISLILIWIGHQIFYRFLLLMLLPEFWITNQMRIWNLKPLPGTYIFDRFIEYAIKIISILRSAFFIAVILGIVTWYARPYLEGEAIVEYIDNAIEWWYSIEGEILRL